MKTKILGLLAVGLLAGPMVAKATSIATDGTWYEAVCRAVGSDCIQEDLTQLPTNPGVPPWTFSGPANVTLVDGYEMRSDQYALYDFGSLVGTTTASAAGFGICGNDPDAALANSSCGSGVFSLGSGNHSLTIRFVNSSIDISGMFFRVQSSQVPEPGSLALLGLGLIGMGLGRRRKAGCASAAI